MFAFGVIALICACAYIQVKANPPVVRQTTPVEPYYRSDYKYFGRQQAFYKIHTLPLSWRAARDICELEGAQLVHPETQDEAAVLTTLMNDNLSKSVHGIWLGSHDLFAEGVYVTLDGLEVSLAYSNWGPNEPNDAGDNEDCVCMTREGNLNDNNCNTRFPAVCKKLLATISANPVCETADLAYVPNADKSRCYKVHIEPKNWSDAYATCHAEQSYLTILNDPDEVNLIVKLLQQVPDDKIKGQYHKGHVAIGFHDLYHEGQYLTIHGKSLQESGYCEWQGGQPDNYNGNEDCGSITRSGKLNDINCAIRMLFICEREIGDPNVADLFSRYGTSKSMKTKVV